jgi:chromosome partitioning protein
MKVISLINQKGGTGKTTSAVNIAGKLKMLGKKVLLVDLDYQRNLTVSITGEEFENTIFNVMANRVPISEVIHNANGFDLIPGDIKMRKLEKEIEDRVFKELILSKSLNKIKENYDYCIIDCRPDMELKEKNALIASDLILVPTQPQLYSLEGLDILQGFKEEIELEMEKEIHLKIFCTMVNTRANNPMEIIDYLKNEYEGVMDSFIRHTVKLQEAPNARKTIFESDPKGNGAKDYTQLVEELMHGGWI